MVDRGSTTRRGPVMKAEDAHCELSPAARDALEWCARTTRDVVEKASHDSEAGVLEVGRAVGQIVSEAQQQAGDFLQVLPHIEGGEQSSTSIRRTIAEQSEAVAGFVTQLETRVAEQNQVATHAVGLTSDIATLAREVSSIASRARLLSINARIECARLGERGKAMAVVASEVRAVSAAVTKANSDIADLAARLNELLPVVARLASELTDSSHAFSAEFAQRQSATRASYDELIRLVTSVVATSRERVDRVLAGSQAALSALNFQDPMAQSLRELGALIEHRCTGVVGAEIRAGTPLDPADGDLLTPGEVALF